MVDALLDARYADRPLAQFAAVDAPRSLSEAFAVQDEMTRRLGARIAGWKVGYVRDVRLTHAPVYEGAVVPSGTRVHLPASASPAVEGEVGFVFGRDLPPRGTPYSFDEVAAAMKRVVAAIEIGAPRLSNFMEAPLEHKIADNVGACALIHGDGIENWRALDLAKLHVTLRVNGEIAVDTVGGNASGNPFDAVIALANSAHRREPLRAGQVIITGTCTGIHPARPGMDVLVQFDGLGDVSVVIE
jgi:2-keto-4-pentenoate hydratase